MLLKVTLLVGDEARTRTKIYLTQAHALFTVVSPEPPPLDAIPLVNFVDILGEIVQFPVAVALFVFFSCLSNTHIHRELFLLLFLM